MGSTLFPLSRRYIPKLFVGVCDMVQHTLLNELSLNHGMGTLYANHTVLNLQKITIYRLLKNSSHPLKYYPAKQISLFIAMNLNSSLASSLENKRIFQISRRHFCATPRKMVTVLQFKFCKYHMTNALQYQFLIHKTHSYAKIRLLPIINFE